MQKLHVGVNGRCFQIGNSSNGWEKAEMVYNVVKMRYNYIVKMIWRRWHDY